MLPIIFVKGAGDWTAVILIGFAWSAHQAWSANLFATTSDMFPKRVVASVVGLGGMAGSSMGFLFPILAGRLLDRFKAQDNISGGYTVLFAVCSGAYLVAFVLQHLLAPRFEMTKLKAV